MGEERFLQLWTILEVYPMEGSTHIRRITNKVSQITGRNADEVLQRLYIGRLTGARANLVHKGQSGLTDGQLSRACSILQTIVGVVMKSMVQLAYQDKEMDRLLAQTPERQIPDISSEQIAVFRELSLWRPSGLN